MLKFKIQAVKCFDVNEVEELAIIAFFHYQAIQFWL